MAPTKYVPVLPSGRCSVEAGTGYRYAKITIFNRYLALSRKDRLQNKATEDDGQ